MEGIGLSALVYRRDVIPDNWSLKLSPWSFWGQRWDPSPEPDPNRFYNCGPEGVAMCVKYWADVDVQAAYYHALIEALNGRPIETQEGTILPDMLTVLRKYCGAAMAELRSYPNDDGGRKQMFYDMWHSLMRGAPIIGLRSFSAPASQPLHYGVVMGMNPQEILEADPWTGNMRTWSYDDYWTWSWNYLIFTHRTRSLALR